MGYNNSESNVTLLGYLTPYGRQAILTNGFTVINKFAPGDSDANYNIEYPLTTGYIPAVAGVNCCSQTGGTFLTNTYNGLTLRSQLKYSPKSDTPFKSVQANSMNISVNTESLGLVSVTGTTTGSTSGLTHDIVTRTNYTDMMGNLFFSFGLPISDTDLSYFSTITSNYGGFANTALSACSGDSIIVIGVGRNLYGEAMDGKTIKVDITTTSGVRTLYSTYRGGIYSPAQLDAIYTEQSKETVVIGNNIAFLFCDDTRRPNGNPSKSWSTGWNTYKPFSVYKKETFNYTDVTTLSKYADQAVGIAYLDKGFIVITDPTIVGTFDLTASTATTVAFNSVVTRVTSNITCILDRGEFGRSNNSTWKVGDVPRLSELGLYDVNNNLIAVAKTDRHIEIPSASFMALTVTLVV
jgi:hypothetical protein